MVKNVLIGVVVLVALVIGGVIIAPSFVDSQAIKQEITTQARAATGRDLTIDGNLEIRIFPSPSLTANNVRLSNAARGEAKHMVDMQAVEVRVALAPLLSGQVQVEQIRLVSPQVFIEQYEDGSSNLDMRPPTQPGVSAPASSTNQASGSAPSSSAQSSDMDIRLDNFEIVGGRVVYSDMKAGTREVVEGIDTTLRAGSLSGPFEALGSARVRGVPLAYEASVGQIIQERTVPLNAEIKASAGTKIQLSGAIFDLASTPHFKGSIQGGGENLAQLLNSILGPGTAPMQLSQTFGLEAQVDASGEGADLAELEMQLGSSRILGSIRADLGKGVNFNVDLKSAHVDLDAISGANVSGPSMTEQVQENNQAAAPNVAPAPPKMVETSAAAAKAFAFPKDMVGQVQLKIDAITLKGDIISDFQVSAELADGELTLSLFQAIAPGVTEIAVFGFVAPNDGVPQFQGDIELMSSDPQTLTSWLGVKLPPEIAGRVKRVSYNSKLKADPKQVVVSDLKIQADKSTLSGGVTLAVRDRLSFGADLTLDAINLDTYLNGGAHKPAPTPTTQAEAAPGQAQPAPQTKPEPAADITQALAVFSALNDFDANIKFRIHALTHQGQKLKNFLFDGTLYSGALDLRALSVGSYQGASGKVTGKIAGFGGVPELNNLNVDAKVKNLAQFATQLGATDVPKGVRSVAVKTTLNGSVFKPKIDSRVSALGGTVATKGQASVLPIGFGYEGTLNTKFKDVAAVLKALDIAFNPKGPLGALDLSAKLKTNGKTHSLKGIKSTLGKTAINGDVSAATGGLKPNITADLQTGGLVLDRFMPRDQKNASLREPRSRFGKIAQARSNVVFASFGDEQLAQVSERWSREKFDLSVLNTLDADITLKSDFIQFGDYRLDKADIHANVAKGVLKADRVRGVLFGGPLIGSATVRASGTPTVESNFSLDALQVGQAVKAVSGQNLADGAMSMGLNFSASGLSPADLVSSLSGNGSLNISELDAKKQGKGSALSGIIGLVAAMNKLSLTKKDGKGLADVTMAFDLQDGVATAKELSLKSAMGNGTGSGTVDLAGWGIDVSGNMTVEPNLLTSLISKGRIGRQEVPFSLKGDLDKPGVNLAVAPVSTGGGTGSKIDPFKSLIEKALPGVKLPTQKQPSTQPAPAPNSDGTLAPPPPQSGSSGSGGSSSNDNQKIDAKDLLKGLLRGL
ncbi:AsmA family protein [Magnetovibrio sp. PR-2]